MIWSENAQVTNPLVTIIKTSSRVGSFSAKEISPQSAATSWRSSRCTPVSEPFIAGVWSGQSVEDEALEEIRQMLTLRDQLPYETKTQIDAVLASEEGQALLKQLEQQQQQPDAPPVEPLLDELHRTGLLTKAGEQPTTYAFHELIRECMDAWMATHPDERGDRTNEQVWIAYGERYSALYKQLRDSGQQPLRGRPEHAG